MFTAIKMQPKFRKVSVLPLSISFVVILISQSNVVSVSGQNLNTEIIIRALPKSPAFLFLA